MIRYAALSALALAAPAIAGESARPRHAVSADISYSSDADRTDILHLGLNLDPVYHGRDDYLGLRVEHIDYRPSGGRKVREQLVSLRAAGAIGGGFTGRAQVGTDGHDLLGNASVNDEGPWRKEVFIERDKVETRIGVTRPILYTFVGAALDVPLARHTQATFLGGVQKFTGRNVRTHARATLIQVLKEDAGLSAQLRARWSHNSVPREYDYFSPRQHVELLPVLQVRRFRGGWQYVLAGGYGAQHDTGTDWRALRYINARVSSPPGKRGFMMAADLTYSNTPVGTGNTYDYVRASLSVGSAF